MAGRGGGRYVTVARSSGGQAVLESFMSSVMEGDYDVVSVGRTRAKPLDAVSVAVVGALIGLVLVAALATTLATSDARLATQQALASRIESTSVSMAGRQVGLDALRTDVDAMQARLLAAGDAEPALAARMASLGAVAGTTALKGPGISITMDDAPDAKAGSLNRVLDKDLQDVVNVLWESGADGIAVNGRRLTGTTAIRSAGDAILVNYEPIARPYVVTAVGGAPATVPGSHVRQLLTRLTRDYGLVTSLSEADVALPAGELRQPRLASPRGDSQG
jgi:uncharacterized protein YlxW (UPF0749 family)